MTHHHQKFSKLKKNYTYALLAMGIITSVVFLALTSPIAQDLHYHNFADARTILSIPNFWNIISNIFFVAIGVIGLSRTNSNQDLNKIIFYIGIVFTGLGSSYYHFHPTNDTLLWDRVPMTIAFMSFFSMILKDHLKILYPNTTLWILIIIGVSSSIYWYLGELNGHGDLRPYALVQFLPMIMIPLICFTYPISKTYAKYVGLVILFYALAKVLEFYDEEIFNSIHAISGHSLKHLSASVAVYFIYKLNQSN